MTHPWTDPASLNYDVPTSGFDCPGAPLRAFVVQYRIDLAALESEEAFASSIRAVLDNYVEPHRQVGQETLVVFPESMGLLSLLAGPLGGALAKAQESLGFLDPAAPAEQLLRAVAQALAPSPSELQAVDPPKALFLLNADRLGRNFCELFSDLAMEYGVYLVAGAYMPDLLYDSSALKYVPKSPHVYNQTLLWGHNASSPETQRWQKNLLFTNYKIPVTAMERDLLGIDEGPADGSAAHANGGCVEICGLRFGFATSLPAFAYGYPFGKRPADLDPWADLQAHYAAALNQSEADVMIQADANAGLWATYLPNGAWQPTEWMGSTWRAVADPTVQFRYNLTPMLTGNLLDLPYDGQSSITKRMEETDTLPKGRCYVGNEIRHRDEPQDQQFYTGNKRQFLALAPWVLDDGDRDQLTQTAFGLLAGSGSPLQGRYVQTVLYADLVPAIRGGQSVGAAVQVFAHRGASLVHPEHTRSAYRHALEIGVDGIEIDVHLTADGHIVCFHDETVERTTDASGPVASFTLEQLRRTKLRHGSKWIDASKEIMTLADVLSMMLQVGRQTTLAIELKHPNQHGTGLDQAVLAALDKAGWDPSTGQVGTVTVSLMSFNPQSFFLAQAAGATSTYCALIADLTTENITKDLGVIDPALIEQVHQALGGTKQLLDTGMAKVAGPSYQYMLDNQAQIKRWVDSGTRLRVWTVDQIAGVSDCLDHGVKQITTNDPALVLSYLRGQGLHD